MGDRGQVKVIQWDDKPVYLYAHWGASELKEQVRKVLSRRKRWSDDSYLTRMIFCEMVKDDLEGELGFGIQTMESGDSWLTIELHVGNKTITITEHGKVTFKGTFEEFIVEVEVS